MLDVEPPKVSANFIISERADYSTLREGYNDLFDAYKKLLTMYSNAATAFDSVERRLCIEQDCRFRFEKAFIELKEKHRFINPPRERFEKDGLSTD